MATRTGSAESSLVISAPEAPALQLAAPPPPPPPPPPGTGAAADGQFMRLGGNVANARLVSQPAPVYPPLAKAARVQGTVRFDVQIGADGHVTGLQLLSGHQLLVQAAMDAVQHWVYQPTLLNGNPVPVATTVDVNFTLQE
jgi:protein TonB